jgi:hypothetical protein
MGSGSCGDRQRRGSIIPSPGTTAGVVAAVVVTVGLAASRAVACPPTAILSGPPSDVRHVATLLLRHGVIVSPVLCPRRTVAATIGPLPDARGYWLHIQDEYGRPNDREVADARTVASLIESWVLEEDGDLIVAPPPAEPRPPPIALARPADTSTGPPERWHVMGSAEVADASDGSLWYGVVVGGCRVWSAGCFGGRARISTDAGLMTTPDGDAMSRSMASVTLTATRSLALGQVTIAPLVGLGGGVTRTYDPPVVGDATGVRLDFRLEAETSVMAMVAVTRRWSVVAEAGATFAGGLHRQSVGDGEVLPAPPAFRLRAALGCQYSP